jgi:hypothetical protein
LLHNPCKAGLAHELVEEKMISLEEFKQKISPSVNKKIFFTLEDLYEYQIKPNWNVLLKK